MSSDKSTASLLLFFLGTAPLAFLSGCAASPAEPDEGETEVTGEALKYCPPTDPDYPTCGVVTDPCADATATITASPASINYGASSTIQWAVRKPLRCSGAISVDGQTVGTSERPRKASIDGEAPGGDGGDAMRRTRLRRASSLLTS